MTSLKKCMRKICATSLAVLMFGGSAVTVLPEVAQSGILASALSEGITDDGLVWKENDSGGVTITDYTGNGGNVVIPNEIDGKAVTKIGYGAFGYCTELTGISIPNSVTLIDYGAFYGCTGLTGINMPDSVVSLGRRVFYGCTGLTSVKMSNSITSIEVGVFNGCTKLTDIEIPDNVTLIEESAFCNCTGLKSVTIPKNVKSIGNIAFHGCKALESVTIPDGVTYIGYSAFRGCDELKSVTIPKSVISMGGFEFYACDKLTNIDVDILNPSFSSKDGVLFSKEKEYLRQCPAGKEGSYTIPDSVQQIEEGAFGYCDKLTSIIIPNNRFPVTILSGAFYRCSGLTNITIPNSVVTIGNQAFEYCTGLNSVNIPYSVTNIGERPFAACTSMTSISVDEDNTAYSSQNGVLLNKDKTKLIQYPAGKPDKKYEIGSSVTEIGEGAFKDCTNLESITIPDSVTKIGDSAFEGCNSISIVGKYGTAAEEYARNNNLTFVDVDNPLGYVTGIELDQTSLTLKKGESQKLKVTIIPYNAKDKTVKWSTDNESVAIVDDGTVTAVGKGTATITAESSNGKIAKCKVNVITVEAICIELSDKNLSIEKGKTETLTATIEPDDTTDKTVTWSTDNAEVATVNDGVVTAVDVGIANITARTANGKIATCKVTVFTIDPTNIQLNKTNITITKGKTRTLTATITPDNVTDDTITWTTDNDEVATVSNGSIHGVENGTATITATTSNGISASCKVTVIPFEWEENDDGGVTITDCYYKDYDLIIPSEIDGKPVTRISESLLMWDEVCTVMIPASVTQIEDGFLSTTTYHRKWSSNLWPSIGILGYSGTAAEKLAEEKGLRFADLNKENYNDVIDFECDGGKIVFYVGEGGDVDIPVQIFGSKITEIGESAFGKKPGYFQRPEIDYSKLTSVQIHENITKIGAYAFSKCTGLTNITIPSSVTQIGMFPFAYCSNLENIEVDNSNQNYSSYGGVLFDKNKTRLIVCPEGKKGDFVIPDGVETIEGEAFADCSEITSVTIPDSVTSIGSGAFNNCTKLTTIYGYLNSAAETYATENDLTFVPLDEKPSIPAVSIKINKTSLSLEKGKTEKLTATITPDNATDKSITWTSDDEKVATVSDDGTVKAVSAGVATVTAKTNNGKTATCKVTVKNPVIAVTSVKLNKTAVTIEKGKTETLTATITPDNATDKTVTWTTDNNKVATVANGKITAVSAGVATITAKTNNGKTATCKVTVKNPIVAVTSVKLNKTSISLEKGKTEKLTATIYPDNVTDKNVTWTSDNGKVATVSDDGTVKAISTGTATITATASNGISASCKVTVIPFKWEENANGGVTITGYTGEDGDVVIPLEIDGIAVTEIGDEAFRGCAGLTSITIPESVTEISGDTFSGCDNLVIYGYKNSYAESYAKKCSIPFVAVGNKLSDTETNITVTGDIGENTKLEVSELKPGDVKISGKKACAYYDISLTENGVKVQPNGNVVVKIPYKDGGENIEVYRINDDGSTEKMRSSYDGEYVTFITDHFSKYAIVADAGIKGDTNNDGEVNIADALMISRYDAGMAELEKSQLALSNVNGDGEVNIAVALMISRFDAGLIDSL